jgi:hypothetical protein
MSLLVAVLLVCASAAAGAGAAIRVRRWWLGRRARRSAVKPIGVIAHAFGQLPDSEADGAARGLQPQALRSARNGRAVGASGVIAGAKLGSGGQGAIYEIVGDPDRVLKRFNRPFAGALDNFTATILSARAVVTEELQGLGITLCWPEEALTEEHRLVGYVMRRIAPDFYFTSSWGPLSKRLPRDLAFAVPRQTAHKLPFAVKPGDGLELVRLVAHFLHAMHRHELVYGDISWSNFTFALDPVRLCVHDFDSVRRLGADPFTAQRPADTIDWDDPAVPRPFVATLDSDRYKFGLLAYRMLATHDLHSRPSSDGATATPAGGSSDLRRLWRRAAGAPGTRPQMTEWLQALA